MNFAKSIVRDAYAHGTPTASVGNLKNIGLAKICGVMISAHVERYLPKPTGGFWSSGCLAQPQPTGLPGEIPGHQYQPMNRGRGKHLCRI